MFNIFVKIFFGFFFLFMSVQTEILTSGPLGIIIGVLFFISGIRFIFVALNKSKEIGLTKTKTFWGLFAITTTVLIGAFIGFQYL